jgi:hypothetical protein
VLYVARFDSVEVFSSLTALLQDLLEIMKKHRVRLTTSEYSQKETMNNAITQGSNS